MQEICPGHEHLQSAKLERYRPERHSHRLDHTTGQNKIGQCAKCIGKD